MTKDQAIEQACAIVALAYRSIGAYEHPSDGFCSRCSELQGDSWNYQNDGIGLEYVRLAVVRALKEDGYAINGGFDSITGKEKEQYND